MILGDDNYPSLGVAVGAGIGPGPTPAGLANHWPLDSGSPSTPDTAGPFPGTLVGTPLPVYVPGQVGSALDLVLGSTQNIDVGAGIAAAIDGSPGISMSCWVNRTTIGADMRIHLNINNAAGPSKISFRFTPANLVEWFTRSIPAEAGSSATTVAAHAVTGTFINYLCTCDLAGARMAVYVNGVVEPVVGPVVFGSATYTGGVFGTPKIGVSSFGAAGFLDGALDEVAIWYRELTAAEAFDVFSRGLNSVALIP